MGMIIPAWKAYLKVAWALKTPFVFCMNRHYLVLSENEIRQRYIGKVRNYEYELDFFDCTSFAWVKKSIAHKDRVNSFGYVLGGMGQFWMNHGWNCVITREGVFQTEPQTGTMKRDLGYRPWVVIL